MARLDVMLSWSGPVSRQVALALRDWLPKVIQNVQPFMSEEDIPKGASWLSKLQEALKKASFGILCLTPDNLDSPWLHFEAGAIWKALPESRVCPLLFRIERATDVRPPLGVFQMVVNAMAKDDVLRLLRGVNTTQAEDERLKDKTLDDVFAMWWSQLESALGAVKVESSSLPPPKSEDMLQEILGTVRTISQAVAQPRPSPTLVSFFSDLNTAADARDVELTLARTLADRVASEQIQREIEEQLLRERLEKQRAQAKVLRAMAKKSAEPPDPSKGGNEK